MSTLKWYEVRIREKTGPETWVKKSKFYEARGTKEAAEKYKGSGMVMWVRKTSKEKVLGIGSFFRLGGDLLKELRRVPVEPVLSISESPVLTEKDKRRLKREKKFRGLHGSSEDKEAASGSLG